jgi:serine/threonine protein kinase
MTPEQQRRARDLFEAALDRDPAEAVGWLNRNPAELVSWLEASAPGDPEVREEVRSLLTHHSRAGSFLTQPLVEAAPHLLEDDHGLDPGKVLGPYTILQELGRGGMGRVYLASDARLGRTVALKALPPELTREPTHRDRLRREAQAAAVLTHAGICTVYALEELDGDLYIATEFVQGHTLRAEIASGQRPSLEVVVATARELASALASAHAKGITHRDLKPENVMRTPEGRIKILDFGLARITGTGGVAAGTLSTTFPGAIAGTPAYMAPEQIEGRTAGPAADVFASGVLLYEWISGIHPFHAASELATLARVLDSTPEPLANRAHVPAWLSDVIARCLCKTPADRFGSGAELLQAFDHPAATAPGSSGTTTWWKVHQLVAMMLYILASGRAWQIKEWMKTEVAGEPGIERLVSLWVFVLMGIAASIGGIVRGHLIFTDRMNRAHLPSELRRTRRVRLSSDMLMAALLTLDALLVASLWPVTTVFTICLATGIALAALLMEPATTAAVFGHRNS